MTRFARAKGSKASNEKVPEKATPWSEIKQQLIQKKEEIQFGSDKQKADGEKLKNYNKFLEERKSSDTKQTTWAEFPGVQKSHSKSKERKLKKNAILSLNAGNAVLKTKDDKLQKKKLKKHAVQKKEEIEFPSDMQKGDGEKLKNNKKFLEGRELSGIKQSINSECSDIQKSPSKSKKRLKKLSKKKSNNNAIQKEEEIELSSDTQKGYDKKLKTNKKKEKELRDIRQTTDSEFPGVQKSYKKSKEKLGKNIQLSSNANKKNKKLKKLQQNNGKPRVQKVKPTSMTINGIHYDIAYVDGFPVKKEDAERIKQLRKQMISKGLPKSEIDKALKLERRKAEKALAREKKKVCFNCRKYGHFLSECPEVGNKELIETSATGICFKCGSAEHTHFECKVVRGEAFKYATCFICKEQGHISKQCPDNPRGMYPRGGACKVCGEVTHLKKDCPKYQAEQQQEDGIQAQLLTNDNPDDMGDSRINVKVHSKGMQNKIIKFN